MKVHILAEGQTEATFIDAILMPYFVRKGIYLQTVLINTKIVPGARNFKGGISSYQQVRKHIKRLPGDTSARLVSTMIDFYGPSDVFPGWSTKRGDVYGMVRHVEAAFTDDIADDRFLPYLSLHEYEALSFSKPEISARITLNERAMTVQALKKVRHQNRFFRSSPNIKNVMTES